VNETSSTTRRWRRPWSLRVRVTSAFALGSFAIVAILGIVSFLFAQHYLLRQREAALRRQTFVDARVLRDELRRGESVASALRALDLEPRSNVVVTIGGRQFRSADSGGRDPVTIPASVRQAVESGYPARQRIEANGHPTLVVGLPIPEIGATYFEVFTLVELDHTLAILRTGVLSGSVIAALVGGMLGWWMSRRILRPVGDFADAAERVARGDLHTRIPAGPDADLSSLAASFNHMVDTVERRIDRETRFVSDFSHELRSPLTTLSTATQVMAGRRDELPPRAAQAFDHLETEVHRLQQLVEDLLELGRADAGVADLQLEPTDIRVLVSEAMSEMAAPNAELVLPEETFLARVDKRRLERVLTNLVLNAETHGGGLRRVVVVGGKGVIRIEVEDRGPGIDLADRELVFERFFRGAAAGRRASAPGSGLGLTLVAEHVQLHGGRVWVEDVADGGARFVVELAEDRS
jgi:two-component system sensor histidine kinase MtrB